jgi:putative nucleotidyltransferase with HDIG domain
MIEAAQLVAGLKVLPTLPEAVARLSSLLNDDSASVSDFERVIRPDPALTANLLKAANSAYFRGLSEVRSVREAVGRMGLRRVFEIATSSSICATIPARIVGYDMDAAQFWRHCVAIAVLCERIALETKLMVPDIAFTAGLLHDMGKLVISTCLANGKTSWWKKEDFATVESERKSFGFDHADVGEEIAMRWNLPEAVKDAARWHHEPHLAMAGCDQRAADLVCLADGISYRLGLDGEKPKGQTFLIPMDVLVRLESPLEKLEKIGRESTEEIKKLTEATFLTRAR